MIIFIKTHAEREKEFEYFQLSATDKEDIATKIAMKIPFKTILKNIRNSPNDAGPSRLNLLTTKDLFNIQACYNLKSDGIQHTNDATSVQIWVSEMKIVIIIPIGCCCINPKDHYYRNIQI